jgi:predicted DNA-binding WGR domain protein
MSGFETFLAERLEAGGFSTEDVLSSFLPLAREVLETHGAGFVAPLEGLGELQVDGVRIWYEQSKRQAPRQNEESVRSIEIANRTAVEVLSETRRVTEVGDAPGTIVNLAIGDHDAVMTRPVYLTGYLAWEHRVEHQDELTDIFSLGMILASLACGLDFRQRDDLEAFVASRRNLFAIAPKLHPVFAQAIVRMTALDRRDRAQDLRLLVHALENYRDQKVDLDYELAKIGDFDNKDDRTKQAVVLRKLRERLFDISRRNRLLHFQPNVQSVNLTHGSVPLSFDIKNIRPDQIFVWNAERQADFAAGKAVSLNRYLNFAEALYLPSVLDRIISESRRDRAEFGFAQLRLVICFLRWTNVKEKPIQRFDSPLILLAVDLKKQKGVRDTYLLEPQSSEAEINPIIRHEFRRLYGIELPATIDLTQTSTDDFLRYLESQVSASGSGVTLEKIDRPRIALVHDKARRKLDQYRRRARLAGRGVRQFMSLDYSYDAANYHPLGIKLFSAQIRTPGSRLRAIIEDTPRPRNYVVPQVEPPVVEKERSFFSLEEGEANPYTWQYDLCSVTLANFKYRRMSLVRDYDTLLEQPLSNAAFEATFSLKPRPELWETRDVPPLAERFDVVQCDPTQATAVGEARAGESYIIQGPPGTGKSQTITNLIADYIARGKRILFVCEKRAAIDVVFARLRQRGLGDLCCLIHDSQTDKKEFVMDLKRTYEEFLATTNKRSWRRTSREELLRQYGVELEPLDHVDHAMKAVASDRGLPLRQLLHRAIELRHQLPPMSALDKETLPKFAQWREHHGQIERFLATLRELQSDAILANHPLRLLSPRVTTIDRPLEAITSSIDRALRLLDELEKLLGSSGVPREYWGNIEQASAVVECFQQVAPLADLDQLPLLDTRSDRAKEFLDDVKDLRRKKQLCADTSEAAKGWRERLPATEVAAALEQAKLFEKSRFAWLGLSWWRLRRILNRCYDFRSHVVPPRWSAAIEALERVYHCERELRGAEASIGKKYAIRNDVEKVVDLVSQIRGTIAELPSSLVRLLGGLVKSPQAKKTVARVVECSSVLTDLREELGKILDDFGDRPLEEIRREASLAQESLDDLPEFLHCLSLLGELPAELARAFRRFALSAEQLEAAIADTTLEATFRADRRLGRYTGVEQRRRVRLLSELYGKILEANSESIREAVQDRFREHVRLSGLPAAQLKADQKEFKAAYNRGRRELEHEFGKSMRFKAIRDLVAGDSGEVVKDLKPVWLMSPLSVSDTLPLDAGYFDVVIFDEASQITLEEAVPSLFRAAQAIVVGDEMQLPPTSFFETRKEEDEDLIVEEDGELQQYELESNSFLNHAARNLRSTMLGWHYRSRSESLISFSNWAFYEGRLLTVPEEQMSTTSRQPIVAEQAEDGASGADALLERTVSFHHLAHGVYEKRRNRGEAEYIAQLVCRLLLSHYGRTIAIIAFSEAQQTEIEDALGRLAQTDPEFRSRYEAELEREEDGQFVGLLVKNLENIQGDERDIIILSVCYGRDAGGKMRMNFGPINLSGGEKRLNVAFSRAKHHMAVVSSIQHGDITNDYNEGAACFKNYLRYAEAVSSGQAETIELVLRGLSRWHGADDGPRSIATDPVAEQLADELSRHGYLIEREVGQSHFRCDLAVRRPGESAYCLGILIDNSNYYEQSDILERDVMRPKLLRDFGWNVCQVLAKDWYQARDRVVNRVLALAGGEADIDPEKHDGSPLATDVANEVVGDSDGNGGLAAIVTDEPLPSVESDVMDQVKPLEDGSTTDGNVDRATRYFEFSDSKSSKFWEIALVGSRHSVRFGRIGTAGQELAKEFESSEAARIDFERLVREKLAKGYQEKTGSRP